LAPCWGGLSIFIHQTMKRFLILALIPSLLFSATDIVTVGGMNKPTAPVAATYADVDGTPIPVSVANPLPVTGGGGGGGGASGSVTAAGVNGTLAQAVQGINGGVAFNVNLPTGLQTKSLSNQVVSTDVGLITNSIIHGLSTAVGGGYVDIKVNPSGALTVDATVSSALPAGSALIGKVTLNDGTNSHTIKAGSVAAAYNDTAEVVAIRDTVETINPLVLVPPTVNTLAAAGTVQAQVVPGGVYTFCISSSSTLGATANTLASCTTAVGSTTVTYTGTAPSIGQLLGGTGITPGSYVTSVSAGVSFTMSIPATAAGTVTLNVTAGSFAGNFQSSADGVTWNNINVIPMTFAVNAAATNSFVAPGLFRYASTSKDNYLRFNLTAISSTGVLGNLTVGPTLTLNIDALDRNGGLINLPYVQYVAATAATFPAGITALMPIDRTGLGVISFSVSVLTGTGQTITWRQGNDSTGATFTGLGAISNNLAQNAVGITANTGAEYLLTPSARYISAPITGTATATFSITGAVANVGSAQAATQSVNTINNAPVNISQVGGQTMAAHSAAMVGNPMPTGAKVVPTTAATVDATLTAGDASYIPATTGYQVIQKQFGTAELDWSAVSSLTPTVWASAATLTQVRAASGTANVRTYVSGINVSTDAIGGATSLWLVDGPVAIASATVATPGVFTSGTHDFKIGDAIVLQGIATLAITGVSANQVVYVATVPSATTFTVALTPGGTGVQVTASGTATAYRILKQIRLQTTALPVTTITLPSPIRSAPNVAISLLSSATQTGTVFVDLQGYYGF